jgi:hypothetical protein
MGFIEAMALSRAPVKRVNATVARLRRSTSDPFGIVAMTCFTCSMVGNGLSRRAVATRASFSEMLK